MTKCKFFFCSLPIIPSQAKRPGGRKGTYCVIAVCCYGQPPSYRLLEQRIWRGKCFRNYYFIHIVKRSTVLLLHLGKQPHRENVFICCWIMTRLTFWKSFSMQILSFQVYKKYTVTFHWISMNKSEGWYRIFFSTNGRFLFIPSN